MKSSKVTQNSALIFLVVIVIATVVSRIYGLTFKPIHFDESINAWFSSEVQRLGYYKYDPNNYHGPLYFYILRLFEVLFGKSIATLRAVPTAFSILSILIFLLPTKDVTPGTTSLPWRQWVAGLFLISPAFLFFGRSGIHEMPFAFFQIVFALGLLRLIEKKDDVSISCLMLGLFGMMTLKETFALSLFSFGAGLLFIGPKNLKKLCNVSEWRQAWNHRLTAIAVMLLWFFVVLFSGFFQNFAGLADFVRAFLPWMKTGTGGNGHDKVFGYWLETLWKAEPLAILGVLLAIKGLFSKNAALRLISVFSLVQLFAYSMIPYKTVWCILSIVWGFYFVIAYTVVQSRSRGEKYMLYAAITALGLLNLASCYKSAWRYPIELGHPYVYVNSTYNLRDVDSFISESAVQNKEGLTVQLGISEQWPWPWLLRDQKIHTYDLCSKNIIPDMDVYFCDVKDTPNIEGALPTPYWKVQLEFRQDSGVTVAVYFKKSKFEKVPFEKAELMGGEIK